MARVDKTCIPLRDKHIHDPVISLKLSEWCLEHLLEQINLPQRHKDKCKSPEDSEHRDTIMYILKYIQ